MMGVPCDFLKRNAMATLAASSALRLGSAWFIFDFPFWMLFGLDAGDLDEPGDAFVVRAHECGELLGTVAALRREALVRVLLFDVGVGQHLLQRGVPDADDRARRTLRRERAV